MADEDTSKRSIIAPPKFNDNHAAQNGSGANGQATNNTAIPPPAPPMQQRPADKPPPPKFNAPPPPSSRPPTDSAKAAAIAAAKAAQHATPAQRDRMVMEAAAKALAEQSGSGNAPPAAAPRPTNLGPYQPPEWAAIPTDIPYAFEVMKQGIIISKIDLKQLSIDANRGYLKLGRAPENDILLDHPSSSRLHAVLEFRTDDSTAHLYDPGSTHGCYVNKARITAGEHVQLHVGDMIRFGESSRMHILCGPQELMVEEGPSREQRRQAAALEALRRRKEKDAAAAEAAMARAIAAGGGEVSWGFGADAVDDEHEGLVGDEIDWRAHAMNKGLTEKQQKIADKIKKRENRIAHLQRESEKIQAKQKSMEELTMGQANTLARNEEEIEKAMVEIDELEDQLQESIRDSLGKGKKKESRGAGRKRRRPAGSDDEDMDASSDEDTFYDRTGKAGKHAKRGAGGKSRAGRAAGAAAEEAVDAASLYGKLESLKEERARIEAKLQQELESQKQKSSMHVSKAENLAQDDDSLDAFMHSVGASLESDKTASLKKELAELESQIEQTEKLLKIADPDGYYKPGSKAAEAAVERARHVLEVQRKRKEAEERQKKEAAAARATAKAAFVEEEEEEEEEEEKQQAPPHAEEKTKVDSSIHQLAAQNVEGAGGAEGFGLQIHKPSPAPASAEEEMSSYERRRAGIEASLKAIKEQDQQWRVVKGPQLPDGASNEAAVKVMADLAVLKQASRGAVGGGQGVDEPAEEVWQPPSDQTGDGRTSLNERLGY